MKLIPFRILAAVAVSIAIEFCTSAAQAQAPDATHPWVYQLIEGSQLTEDCPICGIATFPATMRGTFQMRFVSQGSFQVTYALDNIEFTATNTAGRNYKVSGQGVYTVGGDFALLQTLSLAVSIDNGSGPKLCYLTSAPAAPHRYWPMLQTSVDQTNGTLTQQYQLDLDAAPFREIWFATAQAFKAANGKPPSNSISAGDLISSVGRVVRRNTELTANLGIMPIVPDLGLGGLDILTGGEIAFAITNGAFSETLGELFAGDILSDRGRVVRANSELIAPFNPLPVPQGGAGLGALQILDSGEIYFSVQTNFYSQELGATIYPGDLISSAGDIVRPNAQLLAAFNPASPGTDCGLTAIYAWPTGEFWFSTAVGFYDTSSNYYAAGDLLSDSGYIVYRNAELVSAFGIPPGGGSHGLRALYVVSDDTFVGKTEFAAPQISDQPADGLALRWNGGGRVFQLEKETSLAGPYLPASPIDTALSFIDSGVLTNQTQAFYRLRQW